MQILISVSLLSLSTHFLDLAIVWPLTQGFELHRLHLVQEVHDVPDLAVELSGHVLAVPQLIWSKSFHVFDLLTGTDPWNEFLFLLSIVTTFPDMRYSPTAKKVISPSTMMAITKYLVT